MLGEESLSSEQQLRPLSEHGAGVPSAGSEKEAGWGKHRVWSAGREESLTELSKLYSSEV